MSRAINMKIAPLNLDHRFIERYSLDEMGDAELIASYVRYLEVNEQQHHYGKETQLQWLATEISNYLNS